MYNWDCDECPGRYEVSRVLDKTYNEIIVEVECRNCGKTAVASYKFDHIDPER